MEKKVRSEAMDYFKGALVLLMILGHCIQFFGREDYGLQKGLVQYINLTSFSGFYFAYGYVCYLAYFQKDFKTRVYAMAKNALKTLGAYYLSSFCFLALVENKIFRKDYIFDILLLRDYKGWSEFLISFFGIMVLGILLFPVMKAVNLKIALAVTALSIACCFLPYDKIKIPQLAFLIGAKGYTTFPVVQYMLYFVWGVWFSKTNTVFSKWALGAILSASIPAVLIFFKTGELMERFPPSAGFVLGGGIFLYVYYLVFHSLGSRKSRNRFLVWIKGYLKEMGRNTLFYLLISNVMIFAFSASAFTYKSEGYAIGFFVVLLAAIRYLIHVCAR